ncbi:MAG: hypothetical protein SFY70_12030 [Bacteroidia bacterium]|nr:hypothetical protein [Bacteroidia bacterium]
MTLTVVVGVPSALISPLVRRLLLDAERLVGGSRALGHPTLRALDPSSGTLTLDLPPGLAADLSADLGQLLLGHGLDRLRPSRGKVLHRWQLQARQAGTPAPIRIELEGQPPLVIDASTGYAYQELWVAVEVYLYGVVSKMGGRGQARLHVRDERLGLRTLRCHKDVLAGEERNRLYRYCGIHARAQQNTLSGRLEAFEFLQFLEVKPTLSRAEAAKLLPAG